MFLYFFIFVKLIDPFVIKFSNFHSQFRQDFQQETGKSFESLLFRSSHPEVFLEKVFWKYAANLQENTHAEVQF